MRGLVDHPSWTPAFDAAAEWAVFLANPPAVERVVREADAPPAVARLYEAMQDYSEDCWCAGWLIGLEAEVWKVVISDGPDPTAKMTRGDPNVSRDILRRAMMDAGGAFLPVRAKWDGPQPVFASIPDCVAAYAALTNPPGTPDSSTTAADAAKEE